MNRTIYTRTSCGCGMPSLAKLIELEQFQRAAEAQGLVKGRVKPVLTTVGQYVAIRAPMASADCAPFFRVPPAAGTNTGNLAYAGPDGAPFVAPALSSTIVRPVVFFVS